MWKYSVQDQRRLDKFIDYERIRSKRHSYEMNEFCLKLYILNFNGYLSVDKFMNQLTNCDIVIEFLKLYQKEMRQFIKFQLRRTIFSWR